MRGARTVQSRKKPVSTSPLMSMPRCRPTLLLTWEMTGSPDRKDFFRPEIVAVLMSVPHSRVDQRGDDVHDEVGECDDDCQQHHDALDRHEVPGVQVLDQLVAKALPFESGLGKHGSAEH